MLVSFGTESIRELPSGTTMTNSAFRDIAKSAFCEVMLNRKSAGGIIVAVLFVSGQRVFIASPAHGNGLAN
jgi:hypothetical protein